MGLPYGAAVSGSQYMKPWAIQSWPCEHEKKYRHLKAISTLRQISTQERKSPMQEPVTKKHGLFSRF